jgi:zinc protease
MKLLKNLTLFSILVFIACSASAQLDYSQKIPVDTAITVGYLPNGIKYYIKKNIRPEKRMEIRLAVNAGSVLEDKDQIGLAHFTEHMAFNGTKNFAKNELVSYLQTMGIKFGPEINAYTGFDETVYMLQLPTDNKDLLEKGIQILEEWAHGITFDSSEIEKERGVIIEEWRLGRGADQRMQDKYLPIIFHDSRYAERLPIGTKESLETFKRNSITRFYKDWYRPDLMAVVAVGDFDKKEIEKYITKYFSKIPKSDKPRFREIFNLPVHKQTFYSVNSDPEASETTVSIYNKSPFKQEITIGDYRRSGIRMLYFQMLNQRISELLRNPNPPFINASSSYGNIGARKDYACVSSALVSETGIETGLKALLIENERVKKYGFTQGELDRAKLDILKMYDQFYNERDKSESEQFAAEYIRNYMLNEPIPGIAMEYKIITESFPNIQISDVNVLAQKFVSDSNRVIVVTAPKKDGLKLPTEDQLQATVLSVASMKIEPYSDKLAGAVLMPEVPKPGKILNFREIKAIGTTEILLSNGVKVLLKPTDFKDDEILLSAISKGGQFLYPESDNFSAEFCTNIIQESGIGNFNAVELQKVLAGKNANVSPYTNDYLEGMKASCVPKDIETMFQLLYLYFTQPHIDMDGYQSWINRNKAYLANVISDPMVYYSDQLAKIMSQNSPRGGGVPKVEDLDKVNPERALQIYKERYANASDFEFIIVGNFKIDSIRKFLETYLGSLPSENKKENWNDIGIRPPKGQVKKDIFKGSDPKSLVTYIVTDTITYNKDNAYYLKSLEDFLDIRLIEVLREEKSGVYGVSASCNMNRMPFQNYVITFRIPCAPTNTDSLVNEALKIIEDIKQNGISEVNMKKVKESQVRELEVSLKNNSFWLSYLENSDLLGDDLLRIQTKKENIEKLTSKNIQDITKKLFVKNSIQVTLYPEKK